jgi:hypothetical protein
MNIIIFWIVLAPVLWLIRHMVRSTAGFIWGMLTEFPPEDDEEIPTQVVTKPLCNVSERKEIVLERKQSEVPDLRYSKYNGFHADGTPFFIEDVQAHNKKLAEAEERHARTAERRERMTNYIRS